MFSPAFEWVSVGPKSQISNILASPVDPAACFIRGTLVEGNIPSGSTATGPTALKGILVATWCGPHISELGNRKRSLSCSGPCEPPGLDSLSDARSPAAEWDVGMSEGLGASKGLYFGNFSFSCNCNLLLFRVSPFYKRPELVRHWDDIGTFSFLNF